MARKKGIRHNMSVGKNSEHGKEDAMTSPFSKIIHGKEPHRLIAEQGQWLAFLEVKPLVSGHAIVIPKIEVDYLFDLSDPDLAQMMLFSKQIARAMKAVIPCKKIGVAVIGLETRHAHIHLVPISSADDLNFTRVRLTPTVEELSELAILIKNSLSSLQNF